MALARIAAKRITSYEDETEDSLPAIQCRLHYEQTRDALLRSHWWRFARGRATLSQNAAYTADTTTFEWTYAYDLPVDFLRMKEPWEGDVPGDFDLRYTYSLEGKQLLSEETTMYIRYIKKVTDPNKFDPLFIEVLVLQLALKMVSALAGVGQDGRLLRRELHDELYGTPKMPGGLMAQVRCIDMQETSTSGHDNRPTWNDAMSAGVSGDPARMNE